VGYGGYVDIQLQNIPNNDQEILEIFFSNMISSEYFGYVLFGDKPIAAAGFETEFTPEEVLGETAIKQNHIHIGWQTWEKYSRFFPSEKFVLKLSKSPLVSSYHWVVLINKETTLKCVQNNLEVFKSVLGDQLTPESILQSLITTDDIFNDTLNQHDGLLGMLFGYGKSNSIKFQHRHRSVKRGVPFMDKLVHKPSKLEAFNKQNRDLVVIALPRFAADLKHPESKALYQSYSATQVQLSNIYRERKFLKPTLEKFISNE
jgi:hypothetical protein